MKGMSVVVIPCGTLGSCRRRQMAFLPFRCEAASETFLEVNETNGRQTNGQSFYIV